MLWGFFTKLHLSLYPEHESNSTKIKNEHFVILRRQTATILVPRQGSHGTAGHLCHYRMGEGAWGLMVICFFCNELMICSDGGGWFWTAGGRLRRWALVRKIHLSSWDLSYLGHGWRAKERWILHGPVPRGPGIRGPNPAPPDAQLPQFHPARAHGARDGRCHRRDLEIQPILSDPVWLLQGTLERLSCTQVSEIEPSYTGYPNQCVLLFGASQCNNSGVHIFTNQSSICCSDRHIT